MVDITIWSDSFNAGDRIPKKYTCDGADMSPPLSWIGIPGGTRSIAIIMEDPDAPMGIFTHWVIYNIPNNIRRLPEGLPKVPTLLPVLFGGGADQGINSFGYTGYGGPCPPPGKPHRYIFQIYALNMMLQLGGGEHKKVVEEAISGHIISMGELIGIYGR